MSWGRPAVFLSSFRPGRILKSAGGPTLAVVRIRNALVVFQFAVSIVLLSSTAIVARQMLFIQTKDVGYDGDLRPDELQGDLLVKRYAVGWK
jgi:putative ABC transport system permease protein